MTRILLVEDEKNQRLLYEQELKLENYEILTAADGKEALEKVQEQIPDIIIMDIIMPKMDGIETMGRILSEHKEIPIIIYTAYSSYKGNFMSWMADAYITKSSDLTELKNKIKELITNKSQRLQRETSYAVQRYLVKVWFDFWFLPTGLTTIFLLILIRRGGMRQVPGVTYVLHPTHSLNTTKGFAIVKHLGNHRQH